MHRPRRLLLAIAVASCAVPFVALWAAVPRWQPGHLVHEPDNPFHPEKLDYRLVFDGDPRWYWPCDVPQGGWLFAQSPPLTVDVWVPTLFERSACAAEHVRYRAALTCVSHGLPGCPNDWLWLHQQPSKMRPR
jgi:hypothetical protein